MLYDPERIDDDVLALIFISCHPVLSREASVALTLRVLGGLTSDEIARAFVTPTATVQARITRAKKTLAAAQVPFEVPPPDERRERLSSVLSVIYLIFTEGSSATSGSELDPHRPRPRGDPAGAGAGPAGARRARDARPARPPRAHRRPLPGAGARPTATPVLLEDQDRRRWDRAAIRRGRAALVAAGRVGRGLGRVRAPGLDRRVPRGRAVGRGDRLGAHRPAVRGARLARALADRRAQPRRRGLDGAAVRPPPCRSSTRWSRPGDLKGSHLLPGVRGELLTRLGRTDEARAELEAAVRLCPSERERDVLQGKLDALGVG